LNQILSSMKFNGFSFHNQQNYTVDKRVIYEMDTDIRVTMSWDADAHDVELHCVEPDGDVCYSLSNHTRSGGMLSRDFQGYGPEEYLIRKAKSGNYIFKVKLFSPTLQTIGDSVTVIVRFYLNWGRPQQEMKTAVVRLFKPKEIVEVGRIFIP